MYFSTQAVILSSWPLGDYDCLIYALAREHGLLTLKLCGARRSRSRLSALKEPGMLADLLCYGRQQAGICRLITGKLVEEFLPMRADWRSMAAALGLLRFTQRLLTPYDPRADEKFALLLETLAKSSSSHDLKAVVIEHKLKMFELSGWQLSASDLAKERFDDSMRELCRCAEQGRWPSDATADGRSLERFDRIIDLHLERIVSR